MRRTFLIAAAILVMGWLVSTQVTHLTQNAVSATTRPVMDHGVVVDRVTSNHPATGPSERGFGRMEDFQRISGKEGFWRLGQDSRGVWWFISPQNKLEFLNTVTTVQPNQESRESSGAHFISADWDGKGDAASLDKWAKATADRVTGSGFKGLGAWCNPAMHRQNIPMSQDLNIWTWIDDASKRFYTADWPELAEAAVKAQVVPLKDNRNLIGYFIDNELDWGDGFSGAGAYFDHLSPSDPNRREVLKVIHETWPKISDFNLAWETKYSDWTAVESWRTIPRECTPAYARLNSAWLSHLAADYFKLTTILIRKYDPNHLILGVRFKGYAPEEVVRGSRGYTDAQSLNYYVDDAQLDSEMFRMMNQQSGQPIIISEYSFHSLDGRSEDKDTVGFAAQVPDQQGRADGYRLMTNHLARVPYIIGADWFQWSDEPGAGRAGDGEDVNFGVVDVHDQPYNLLVDAIRQTAATLNPLHAASVEESGKDIWRESYANKPVMHVPYLAKIPNLDGDMTDWVKDSHFTLRREQVVGIDRRPISTPNIYMGWTNDGLYLGMEVFDNHLETAPASGWWWTRDNVEFWISTRPVTSDEYAYDLNAHQFFFVPSGPDPKTGPVGVVGQWHRDGDALSDHLIPDTAIQTHGKILPDRYIVQMLIPAKSLHGFDPVHQPALAFNIHVRDFDSAADFFWSAPKSSQTELRPNTWGTLYLDAPPAAPHVASNVQASLQ